MLPTLLALAFIACLFIVVISGQPDEFTLSRSAKLAAPPEKIFPHVNDLHAWEAWSPGPSSIQTQKILLKARLPAPARR